MIDFGTLRYIWPQLVALHNGSRKRCLLTIGSLLKSYSEDLGRLATAAQLKEDVEEDQASSDLSFEYEVAERFLFETAAIEALEVRI